MLIAAPDVLFRTDVGQSRVFAKEYSNKLRYSPVAGFINFNATFWEESDDKARTQVHELTERQLEAAKHRRSSRC